MRRALLPTVLFCLGTLPVMAQDPVKVDPDHHKVVLENDEVRVLRWTIGPHEKSVMHEHPANVVVFLTDADVKFMFPDGKTAERHLKAGQVTSSAPVKHETENIGDKPIELVQVELKTKPAGPESAKK